MIIIIIIIIKIRFIMGIVIPSDMINHDWDAESDPAPGVSKFLKHTHEPLLVSMERAAV